MNQDNFIGPPTIWVVLTVIGGITTAVGLIITLEYVSKRLSPRTSSAVKSSLTVPLESHLEIQICSIFDYLRTGQHSSSK